MEIRKAFSESDLEVGVWYNVRKGGVSPPNVFPYEGKVDELHAFMYSEDTLHRAPIESFRGNVGFSEDGLVILNVDGYDCYMPEDQGYKSKWEIIKRK